MIRLKKVLTFIMTALLLVTLSACGAAEKQNEKIQIVATNFPLYDFARQIAGDRAEVTMLISPGSEVHSFEPTPKQIIGLTRCHLFLYIGGESDKWVDTLLDSTPLNGTSLALINSVETIVADHDDEHTHIADEHIWTSPKNAAKMVKAIADALCSADSEGAAEYIANADAYIKQLNGLDSTLNKLTKNAKNRTLVFGDRFPFAYLVKDYGLEAISAYPGCYNNTEPGAATVASITQRVKDMGIPVVFYIEFSNKKVATAIAEETGATLLQLHSCHNVSAEDFKAGVTYVQLMTKNIENLERALG